MHQALKFAFSTKPPMFTIVDIVEQGRVPILFSPQEMKNFHIRLAMRPDRVLITCEALGLLNVQAAQASSSHIVIDLADIISVPSRTFSEGESDFPCVFAGDSEMALGTCPACAGRHRPHTYAEGCNKATTSATADTVLPNNADQTTAGTSPDRVLADPLHVNDEVHLGASSSSDPRPPGLEPQPGRGPDTMPREQPAIETHLCKFLFEELF